MTRTIVIGGLLLCFGCAGRGAAGPVGTAPSESGDDEFVFETVEPPVLVSIVPGARVEEVPRDCTVPIEETCNALDDDCNGVIDDECGYGPGLIQVTAGWDTGSDIDLYVTGPLGDTLSFQRPSTPAGARVDQVGRGDCAPDLPNPRIENIRWVGERPIAGIYEVEVHYWGECISGGGPTEVTVSVAVGRRIAGQYRLILLPGERTRVVRFVIQ
ncbi:MAG: hypothetical protein AAF500_06690 [Myxococcota bacterium]